MSQRIGDELPAELARTFDGTDLDAKIGLGFVLVTVDDDGTARPCMLSAGELLATGARELRISVWPGTNTAANLATGRPVLFCYVADHAVFYVRGTPRRLTGMDGARQAGFGVTVDSVESDLHTGMPVTGGIVFAVKDEQRPTVVASWDEQLAALRAGR